MLSKKVLFISTYNFSFNVFSPVENTIKTIPLEALNKLSINNTLIICNKFALQNKYINNNLTKDILLLYAFIFPTRFANNSIAGLAKSLNIEITKDHKSECKLLYLIYTKIIEEVYNFDIKKQQYLLTINQFMATKGEWGWYNEINNALRFIKPSNNSIKVWQNFSNVEIVNSQTKETNNNPINNKLVLNILNALTKKYNKPREAQKEYSTTMSNIFNENKQLDINSIKPNVVFAEAGTGVGKTIGYLAAIIAFINKNPNKSVLISTYSKNLQKQILKELSNTYNNFNIKATLIKGNQNYVCLLNVDYLLSNLSNYKNAEIFFGLILRWLQETQNGDIPGGDFLPWLKDIIPNEILNNILNKKEECLYSKCKYYKKCFITKVKEQAKNSNIIISNHKLTLLNKFNTDYIVLDEAHNLYNVSDDVYSYEISANKAIFLKSWILGGTSKSRSAKTALNGLEARLNSILFFIDNANKEQNETNHYEELHNTEIYNKFTKNLSEHEIIDLQIKKLIKTLNYSTEFLPTLGYLNNIKSKRPEGAFEEFLYNVYNHVLLHNSDLEQFYTLESNVVNLSADLQNSSTKLLSKLESMLEICLNLQQHLNNKLKLVEQEYKSALLEFINTFEYVCINLIRNFIELLNELNNKSPDYIYRFVIDKEENNILNIGYFKNHLNPLKLFSKNIVLDKKGIAFTSATLFDTENDNTDENFVLNKFALSNKEVEIVGNIKISSPFNYKSNCKVIILSSSYSNSNAAKSEALLQLFLAVKGGTLAIFTSVLRLKQTYEMLRNNILLQNNKIEILAQYNKDNHLNSVVELFKENEHSCLLGSDSFRDGVDIPGKSLRMVVLEKVPWLRKNILNKVRKEYYGSLLETESVRFKLRQAFGRIIRTENDKGIFLLLESRVPSKFLNAFPKDVEIQKISLEEAVAFSKLFLEEYVNS